MLTIYIYSALHSHPVPAGCGSVEIFQGTLFKSNLSKNIGCNAITESCHLYDVILDFYIIIGTDHPFQAGGDEY